jgi:hypothetical protein
MSGAQGTQPNDLVTAALAKATGEAEKGTMLEEQEQVGSPMLNMLYAQPASYDTVVGDASLQQVAESYPALGNVPSAILLAGNAAEQASSARQSAEEIMRSRFHEDAATEMSGIKVHFLCPPGSVLDILDIGQPFCTFNTKNSTPVRLGMLLCAPENMGTLETVDIALAPATTDAGTPSSGLYFRNEITKQVVPVATASTVLRQHPYFADAEGKTRRLTSEQIKKMRENGSWRSPPLFLRLDTKTGQFVLRNPLALWYAEDESRGLGRVQPPHNSDESLSIQGVSCKEVTTPLIISLESEMVCLTKEGEVSVRTPITAGTAAPSTSSSSVSSSSSAIDVTRYFASFLLYPSSTDKSLRECVNDFRSYAGLTDSSPSFEGLLHLGFRLTLTFVGDSSPSSSSLSAAMMTTGHTKVINVELPVPVYFRSVPPEPGRRSYYSTNDKQVRGYLASLGMSSSEGSSASAVPSVAPPLATDSSAAVTGRGPEASAQGSTLRPTSRDDGQLSRSSPSPSVDADSGSGGSSSQKKRTRKQAGLTDSATAVLEGSAGSSAIRHQLPIEALHGPSYFQALPPQRAAAPQLQVMGQGSSRVADDADVASLLLSMSRGSM